MTDEELIALIYLALGITEDDIPLVVVQLYLDQWQDIYPDNECQVLYNTTVSVYGWLIRQANATAVDGKRREKKGRREIEVVNSNAATNWQNALDDFIEKPWVTYPQCRSELTGNIGSRIIIGGVKKDEVERVQDNSNSYSQYSEKSPFSPKPNINRGSVRGFRL